MFTSYSLSHESSFQPLRKTYEVHVEYWCNMNKTHKRKYLHFFADDEEKAKQKTFWAMGSQIEILSIEEI